MFFLRNQVTINFFHQILKNCHFGVKKIITYHMDLYDPYMVPYTIPQGYYNFPRSTNKIQSFDKILTSQKKLYFFAFFCCGGGSNLIVGTGMENQIFILRTPATINFFHQILKK